MDTLSTEQRSLNMAKIHSKDTKPEVFLRSALHKAGFRFRKNDKRYLGTPDIFLPHYNAVIFIHGCFWHGHEGCKYYVVPKSNTKFWQDKILRNQQRDLEVMHKLAEMGWHTIVVWECELKPAVREQTLESLAFTLNHIFLQDRSIRLYELPEEDSAMAAEPEPQHRE